MPRVVDETRTHCSSCGTPTCVCRPTFVDQQPLDAGTLNGLVGYLREQHRRQNRRMGWGVVCGLQVRLADCPGYVTVHPGEALSPCGDDIEVCSDQHVAVCDLIEACCREGRRLRHCSPYDNPLPDDCLPQGRWLLKIRYDEEPVRRMSAARPAIPDPCGSRSSSSGSPTTGAHNGGCSCGGCDGSTSGRARPMAALKPYRPGCEPTVVCERYRFEVCRIDERAEPVRHSLVERLRACLGQDEKPTVPADKTVDGLRKELSAYASHLRFLDQAGQLPPPLQGPARNITALQVPQLLGTELKNEIETAKGIYLALRQFRIRECLCGLLAPPCPGNADDDAVPLAVLTVRADGCVITDICEWSVRRIVPTGMALQYWISLLPFTRNPLAAFCCEPTEEGHVGIDANVSIDRDVREAIGLLWNTLVGDTKQAANVLVGK